MLKWKNVNAYKVKEGASKGETNTRGATETGEGEKERERLTDLNEIFPVSLRIDLNNERATEGMTKQIQKKISFVGKETEKKRSKHL